MNRPHPASAHAGYGRLYRLAAGLLSGLLVCLMLTGCGYVWRGQEGSLSENSVLGNGSKTLKIKSVDVYKRQNLTIVRVPGAFEMPLACKKLAASGKYDGIVAVGAVIRGGTPHFDFVAAEATKGLAHVSLSLIHILCAASPPSAPNCWRTTG